MEYRKKPVVVEAFQYDGDMINSGGKPYVPAWALKAIEDGTMYYKDAGELYIKTLEGDHHISVGDYIIKGVAGELYPCKPDIFHQTYEESGITGPIGDSIGGPRGPEKMEDFLYFPDSEIKIIILGTEYTIKKDGKMSDSDGVCDDSAKKITIADIKPESDSKENLVAVVKKVVRHEILHAFLCESGLAENSEWAQNEEMVDWIAIQGPKIFKAWQEAGAV